MAEERRLTDHNSVQLIQAEKLASIGHLAAGVAHEVNNPLGFIDSNLSTLTQYIQHFTSLIQAYSDFQAAVEQGRDEAAGQAKARLSRIAGEQDTAFILQDITSLITESRQGVERIKKIIASLKMFSKVTEEEKVLYDLKSILESVLSLTENETKYKAKVKTQIPKSIMLECFPQQLGHVFINLILNAVESIVQEGEISVRAEVKKLSDGDIGVGRRSEDPFRSGEEAAVVCIEDTGQGIPKDIMPKLFDPFFTTKDVNQGPGLGLTLSYEIVRKHGGVIDIQSEEDKGTKVAVILPMHLEST